MNYNPNYFCFIFSESNFGNSVIKNTQNLKFPKLIGCKFDLNNLELLTKLSADIEGFTL